MSSTSEPMVPMYSIATASPSEAFHGPARTINVSAQDAAGNSLSREITNIMVDTRPTTARIMTQTSGFSPNDDSVKDVMVFDIFTVYKGNVASWNVTVINEKTIGSIRIAQGVGGTVVPSTVTWNGKTATGTAAASSSTATGSAAPKPASSNTAAEGTYYAVLNIEYEKGNAVQERSALFIVDVTPPKVQFTVSPVPFSPDDDGINDRVNLTLSVTDTSPIEDWQIEVYDPAGNLFTEFTGQGNPLRLPGRQRRRQHEDPAPFSGNPYQVRAV